MIMPSSNYIYYHHVTNCCISIPLWPSQEDNSQQAMQDLRDSVQINEVEGNAALSDIRLDETIDETEEEEKTTDDKVTSTMDDIVEGEAQKTDENEEKDSKVLLDDESGTTLKSRDRPKSVLKNKTPTPVITTSTTPNDNPHRDRECCNIS